MAIEIVDFPINSMVIFQFAMLVITRGYLNILTINHHYPPLTTINHY